MPMTPLHLAVALPVKKYISVIAFIIPNILIDTETVLIILFGMDNLGYALHGNMHTLGGATVAAVVVFLIGRSLPWFYGAFLGAYSHILLDALVHTDVQPFMPFLEGNPLHLGIHVEVSIICAIVLSYYLTRWVVSLRISEIWSSRFKYPWWRFLSSIIGK